MKSQILIQIKRGAEAALIQAKAMRLAKLKAEESYKLMLSKVKSMEKAVVIQQDAIKQADVATIEKFLALEKAEKESNADKWMSIRATAFANYKGTLQFTLEIDAQKAVIAK